MVSPPLDWRERSDDYAAAHAACYATKGKEKELKHYLSAYTNIKYIM